MSALASTSRAVSAEPAPSQEVVRATACQPQSVLELLEASGSVSRELLQRARLVHERTGERLAFVLTRLGFISERRLAEEIAEATEIPLAAEDDYANASAVAAQMISPRFLRDAKALPLALRDGEFSCAFVDPLDPYTRQALALALGRRVRPLVGGASQIEAALDRTAGAAPQATLERAKADDFDLERLEDLASDAPAIRAVNRLISRAVEERASDIHIEPGDSGLRIRFRVDGLLREVEPPSAEIRSALISRIKVMAGLNISERRLPQDGRLRLTVRGHDLDLRAAVSPSLHGESVVLRLLDRSQLSLDFESLGFSQAHREKLASALAKPHGIMLVTGPTGSGKTTSLYAALTVLNRADRKLLTIEDPIEYRLAGVTQTQVAPAIDLTFATALRSFLRQDPDVIMVGEIRDVETAQVAVQAALTGHSILSTLHTNSAATAITRLLDMGVEPFLITSTLHTVLSQRLVRRLCPQCRTPAEAGAWKPIINPVDLELTRHWKPVGCTACNGSGYLGRIALAELLTVDDTIARLILARADAHDIEAAAVRGGMTPLWGDGLRKVGAGLTTIQEVLSVAQEA